MKLHGLIIEDFVKMDEVLTELETDLSTLHALAKQLPDAGFKPSSLYIKRLWQAHEKLGDIYSMLENVKRT